MAAASTEPHPSSPARPPSLSPAPKLLPRDKQTRRQGRLPPLLPPPRSPPFPAPGPSGLRLPSCDSSPSPSQRGRVRAAAAWTRKALPPSLPRRALPGPPGSAAGFWKAPPPLATGTGLSAGRVSGAYLGGETRSSLALRDFPSTQHKTFLA